jgi:hypothetical protein
VKAYVDVEDSNQAQSIAGPVEFEFKDDMHLQPVGKCQVPKSDLNGFLQSLFNKDDVQSSATTMAPQLEGLIPCLPLCFSSSLLSSFLFSCLLQMVLHVHT